jgi:hypothetical protein
MQTQIALCGERGEPLNASASTGGLQAVSEQLKRVLELYKGMACRSSLLAGVDGGAVDVQERLSKHGGPAGS